MNNLFALVQLGIVIVVFFILSKILKDEKVRAGYPALTRFSLKLGLIAIMVSQWGLIFELANSSSLWLIFDVAVLVCLVSLYKSFASGSLELELDFIDHTSSLEISSSNYSVLGDGIEVRRYEYDGKAVIQDEIPLIKIASNFDSERFEALFIRMEAGSMFPWHTHKTKEFIYLSEGSARIIEEPPLAVTPGKPVVVPAKTLHYFKSLEFCIGVLFLTKS